jgi:hypothetical protein
LRFNDTKKAKTESLAKNPKKGGSPAKERILKISIIFVGVLSLQEVISLSLLIEAFLISKMILTDIMQ